MDFHKQKTDIVDYRIVKVGITSALLAMSLSACYYTPGSSTGTSPGGSNSGVVRPATPITPVAPSGRESQTEMASKQAPSGVAPAGAKALPVPGTPAQAPVPITAAVPAEPVQQCFTVAYRHKTLASHSNAEACSHHKNAIKLHHAGVNSKSICVRVNGTPVRFQRVKGQSDELLIGPIAGPHAKIEARYCIGKATCSEGCKVPKDEFLDAIGGSAEAAAGVGQWEAGDSDKDAVSAHLDSDLKRELADIDGAGANEVFKEWVSEQEQPACGTKQASNDNRS